MLSQLFRRLIGSRDRSEQDEDKSNLSVVFLHSGTDYHIEVIGVSDHQAELREIVGADTQAGQQHDRSADLILDENNPYEGSTAIVAIDGMIVGYLPPQLAAQYREWLHKWRLSEAFVRCNAVIVDQGDRSDETARYVVKLGIELPFKMTSIS